MSTLPLADLRVVDLADEFGDLTGRLLADLGAQVVRIEPPDGAPTRSFPPLASDGTSLWFAHRNSNKSGLSLDVSTPDGSATLHELAAGADVVIDNGTLDVAALHAANPALIICSVTPFGLTGPYAGFEATDEVVYGLSGNLSMSGIPEKPPLFMPGSIGTDAAGVAGAYAVCVALYQRRRTGEGQQLDVSALEAAAQLHTWGLANTSSIISSGADASKSNTRAGTSVMYPNYKTSDGHVRCVILSSRQWDAMFEWMGKPEAFAAEEWGQTFFRIMNMDVLSPFIAEHYAPMTMVEAAAEAQRRGVVATPMLTPGDLLTNEHFESRETFVDTQVSDDLNGRTTSGFMLIDGERVGYRSPAPEVGGSAAPSWAPVESPAAQPDGDQPLAGLRVLDFGHGGVGVEAGRMFAEYGADVIKMESRSYPDFIRIVMGSEMTPSFASSSRSKRSFGVDLKSDGGRDIVLELAKSAHVVIENNSTGTMNALGIGFDDLKSANPDIVMVSSQLMGGFGTYAEWSGYGPTIQTAGGLNWLWAFDDGDQPPGSNAIHPDHLAGRVCALASLAALLGGGGAHCEVAQVEALINTLGDILCQESLAAGSAKRLGNTSDRGAPWGVYRCEGEAENWCVVTVRSDAEWAALCDLMGTPELAADSELATAAGRLANRQRCDEAVSAWTATQDRFDVMTACQAAGIPAGTMLTSIDQLENQHFIERGFLAEVDQSDHNPPNLVLAGPCFRGSAMPEPVEFRAPKLGEHTRDIAAADLGFDEAKIDQLIAEGTLEIAND